MTLSREIRWWRIAANKRRIRRSHKTRRGDHFEPLEARALFTTLFWVGDVSNAWNANDQNWNTAADGSGDYVAWDNEAGDDAVFANTQTMALTISSAVSAN